jgi:MFS family permease
MSVIGIPEPERGRSDRLPETPDRATIRGLAGNSAYWTATLGMAMMTFALGGLQVWMPTFLSRARGIPLARANLIFGGITGFDGIVATLLGGWLGDRLLRRTSSAYYMVSAAGMALTVPVAAVAIYVTGSTMFPAILLAAFLVLLNTGPLNAAVVNSVGARIRARAAALNLIVIHILGDAFSPPLIGYISDHSSLEIAFAPTLVALALASGILFYGMRFAPRIPVPQTKPHEAGGS